MDTFCSAVAKTRVLLWEFALQKYTANKVKKGVGGLKMFPKRDKNEFPKLDTRFWTS